MIQSFGLLEGFPVPGTNSFQLGLVIRMAVELVQRATFGNARAAATLYATPGLCHLEHPLLRLVGHERPPEESPARSGSQPLLLALRHPRVETANTSTHAIGRPPRPSGLNPRQVLLRAEMPVLRLAVVLLGHRKGLRCHAATSAHRKAPVAQRAPPILRLIRLQSPERIEVDALCSGQALAPMLAMAMIVFCNVSGDVVSMTIGHNGQGHRTTGPTRYRD
mmetsp:Transcript_74171/g.174079  ORF Transcript_74171/g.174079 Transcript_74171/m.174079 type:complete len:221 (-) Transcript_74171:338-1000(-)